MDSKRNYCQLWHRLLFVLVFLIALAVCPLHGQTAGKKTIAPEDYKLWGKLANTKLSSDGKWIAARMVYKQSQDTLIIINTESKEKTKRANCLDFEFSPNGEWLMTFAIDQGIDLIKLGSEASRNFDSRNYEFSKQRDKMGIIDNANSFFLIDLENDNTSEIKDAKEFAFSPDGKWLALVTEIGQEHKVELVDTKTLKRTMLLTSAKREFSNLVWNDQSNGLAFMETEKDNEGRSINAILYEYRQGTTPQLHSLYPEGESRFPIDTYISATDELFYAADGQRIFFNVRLNLYLSRNLDSLKQNVQVWKGDDPWIMPEQIIKVEPDFGPWLMKWTPKNNDLLQIGTHELPIAYLGAQENFALVHNPKQYEPNYKFKSEVDLYLLDLFTGKKELFLERQTNSFSNFVSSPSGRYITYYKEGHWWVYDGKNKVYNNITLNLPFPLDEHEKSYANSFEIFGCGGWDENEKWVFIYDEFDIWKISPNGRESHKITDGRNTQTTFRIYKRLYEDFPFQRFGKFPVLKVPTENEIILSAIGPDKSGYYTWSNKNGVKELIWKETQINSLKKSKVGENYIFREESYNFPRRLYFQKGNQEPEIIYESNPHYTAFVEPRQELITYEGPENEELHGILMYPDNYQEGHRYPMIVHIYEKLSDQLHDYINPTLYNTTGFNPKLYTSDGYFVLYPDIVYKLRDPGVCATKCVTRAVETVLKTGLVDKARVGLQGHSFGGYEAAFIATQTDIFSAIVAGAAATDLTSFYFTIGWNDGRPDMWRFESQQWRFGCSFYEDPQAYYRNSPLHQAENIKTPLLLWTGANDWQINANQSIEFYLALRRLNKEVTFLYYPNENHALNSPKFQVDLTKRMKEWFGQHLKY
ncbi:MAG: S9 family peptidase [Flavobacteriaceae bacterium]|nr:S9 family peptidase [Flavobacteriaceae bacterium]